jgi:hypothetical protein
LTRQSWQLYRGNLRALFLVYLPFAVLTAALFFALVSAVTVRADNVVLLILAREVLRLAFSSLGVAAVVLVVADRLAGKPGSVRESLRETMSFGSTILAGSLLAAFPYILTFFTFGPYMTPLLRQMFVGPPIVITAIVLERRRLWDALSRARGLLETHWSRILLYLITISAAVGIVDFLAQWGLQTLVDSAPLGVGYSVAIVVSIALPALVMPYIACVWLVAYFDLRARAEDFDEPAMIALRQAPK